MKIRLLWIDQLYYRLNYLMQGKLFHKSVVVIGIHLYSQKMVRFMDVEQISDMNWA